MITFLLCLAALITAYFTYARYLERIADINPDNSTPCHRLADGIDYIEMPRWRVFLIQLLNIAGTGPIFGAILGACFGPIAFLWITLGGIFFGAMHDFLTGVMIVRSDGRSLPEVLGEWLGTPVRTAVRWFSIILLVLVGAVFILSPAQLLTSLCPSVGTSVWAWIIIAYYLLATVLPVDKVIGKCYPVFGAALIAMALGLLGALLFTPLSIPEMSLHNFQPDPEAVPILPTLFITVACGAISGFHATQSPLMARCIGNEKQCRQVFYGSMISESIIALIWAAIAMAFFNGPDALNSAIAEHGNNPAWVVDVISNSTLGRIGAVLAILGVVAAPITSGDTAFRSARLVIADMFSIDQRPIWKRFAVCLPLFAVGYAITQFNFAVVWRYFAWSNQALAVVSLWAIYAWLRTHRKNTLIALIPAIAMTYIETSYIFVSPQFAGLGNTTLPYLLAAATTFGISTYFVTDRSYKLIGSRF